MSVGRCIPELLAAGQANEGPGRSRAPRSCSTATRPSSEIHVAGGGRGGRDRRTLEAIDFEAAESARRKLLQAKAQDFADDWLTRGGEHWGGGNRGGGRRAHALAKVRSGRSIPKPRGR
jgi:hypothetical protein